MNFDFELNYVKWGAPPDDLARFIRWLVLSVSSFPISATSVSVSASGDRGYSSCVYFPAGQYIASRRD